MNKLHKLLKKHGANIAQQYPYLFGLPSAFPIRSEVAFKRLAKEDQQALAVYANQGFWILTEQLNDFLRYVTQTSPDRTKYVLDAMSKRQWTVFKYLWRYWCKAALKHTQTLITWGGLACDGHKRYRAEGGQLAIEAYDREYHNHLATAEIEAVLTFRSYLAGTGDLVKARAESDTVLVSYLRRYRSYLRTYDGRLKPRLQAILDRFRQWVLYQETGDTEEDIIGAYPNGYVAIEQYKLYNNDEVSDYVNEI